jgi:hypothetical protein
MSALLVSAWVVDLRAQAVADLLTPDEPVPRAQFQSWSLFLVCNPLWLLPESNQRLDSLYARFQAFGGAIGPRHVAVWFWSRRPDPRDLRSAVDVTRSGAFCAQLGLPPSGSPYVVVTTDYPGEAFVSSYPQSFDTLPNRYVLSLGDVDAAESAQLLTALADQVTSEELFKADPASEGFWRKWQRAFEVVRSEMIDIAGHVRISFTTTFFKVEMDPNH